MCSSFSELFSTCCGTTKLRQWVYYQAQMAQSVHCDVKLGTMVAAYYDSSNIPPRVLFDESDLFGPHAVPLA